MVAIDLNNLVTATGLIAGAFTIARRNRKVEAKVGDVQDKVDKVHTQLNGVLEGQKEPTVRQLLENIAELDKYSHDRNHDILGALTPTNAALALLLIGLCDKAGINWQESQPGLATALAKALMEAKLNTLIPPPSAPATEPSPSPADRTADS